VFVPAGNTGMEPGKTAFFQALGVPTKIARGTIEITNDVKVCEAGSKVGSSEATLLNMLNISPFTYGMAIAQIYDAGQTFESKVLDIEESQLLKAFSSAISTIATVSLALNYPTLPSVLHSVMNSYKKVLSVAVSTDFEWEEIIDLKDRINNPEKYASAAAAAPAASESAAAAPEAAKEEEKKDEEEDEDEGMYLLRFVLRVMLTPCQTWASVFSTKHIEMYSTRLDGKLEMRQQNSSMILFTLCYFVLVKSRDFKSTTKGQSHFSPPATSPQRHLSHDEKPITVAF